MKLIIPMAGRGTRVRPHSHVTPKPLLNVKGRNLVERIVDTFTEVLPRDIDEGVFVLGPDFPDEIREQLRGICDENDMQARFAVQETAEGTAHAVQSAGTEHLQGEGVLVFADTLFDMEPGVDLEGTDVVAWTKEVDDPRRFGIPERDESGRITQLVEKPEHPSTNEALIGIYYVDDLAWLKEHIDRLIDDDERGKGGEFQLTDAFDRLLQDGARFETANVTHWMDCGTIPALLDTTGFILGYEDDDLHRGEVENCIIHDPVYVGEGAAVKNSVLGPHVSVEAGAEVDGAVLEDSILFQESKVSGAVLKDSLVGRNAEVRGEAESINIGDHSVLGKRD